MDEDETTTTETRAGSADAGGPATAIAETDDVVEDELLIEEVSIDGMCGIY